MMLKGHKDLNIIRGMLNELMLVYIGKLKICV